MFRERTTVMQADDSSGFSCLKDWIIFLTVRSTVAVIVSGEENRWWWSL